MLTPDIRTMDLVRIIKLWDEDKETLTDELLEDYNILMNAYIRIKEKHNEASVCGSRISNKLCYFNRINYKKELGTSEKLYGHVKLTTNLTENIKIINEVLEGKTCDIISTENYVLKYIVRDKAKEIVRLLKLLEIDVKFDKDFEP